MDTATSRMERVVPLFEEKFNDRKKIEETKPEAINHDPFGPAFPSRERRFDSARPPIRI